MTRNKIVIHCFAWLLLFALPAHAEMTRDDIAVLSREGVKVIFPGDKNRHTFPEDIDPDKLLTAEMIDFSDVTLGNKPAFLAWLARFTDLRKLVLRNTGLHATPELLRAFTNMEKLQKLDLSENPLFDGESYSTVKLGSVWGNLPRLNELNLTATLGTVENYGSFSLLTDLHTLHLGNNPQLCTRSLLGRIASWSKGGCLQALELTKLPLIVLDLSNTGLEDDPLPELPVTTLRELSLEKNQLRTLAMRDLPQLEYWNLAGNPDAVLAADFGSVLNLKALRTLRFDPTADIPNKLKQRFTAPIAQQDTPVAAADTAIIITPASPKPAPPAVVLKPGNADEIQAWLSGADQTKHRAALDYLQTAAKGGDEGALHWLGQARHKGWGLQRNWITARHYYQQAQHAGDAQALQSLNALDREAANAITEWGNTGKPPAKGQLAYDLYTDLAKTGNKNAQGWLAWLEKKR